MRVSSSSIISGSATPNVPAARERRAGTNCMCKIWFVSHPIEKFRNERSAAMNIAVAAITLNIFSPFIFFYFFCAGSSGTGSVAVLAVELAAVSLAEVAPAVLAVALLAAVQLAAWRGIRSGAVSAVQVADSLKP